MATAEAMLSRLRGLFCIYKPVDMPMGQIVRTIQEKLSRDLNAMPCRPPRKTIQFTDPPEGDPTSLPTITTVPDLADHTLVLGPRYLPEDFDMYHGDSLATDVSGVQVMALGTIQWMKNLVKARHIRVYHIKGELGRATDNHGGQGRTVERSTYAHVTPAKIDRIIAAMQSGHQKNMLISSKVDLQSQEGYELALRGLARALTSEAGPVVYGVKCIDFSPPHFTLEVHTINETVAYLRKMVHELGLEMKTSASATQVRRVRYGHFGLHHALLHKHWTAQHIIENIAVCRALIGNKTLGHRPVIGRENVRQLPAGS